MAATPETALRLVPTPAERARDENHARFLAESLFTFGRQVSDFADTYPAQFRGRADAQGVAQFRRYMNDLCRLARRFEVLVGMARETASLPVNRERMDAELARVRGKVVELSLGA